MYTADNRRHSRRVNVDFLKLDPGESLEESPDTSDVDDLPDEDNLAVVFDSSISEPARYGLRDRHQLRPPARYT